MAGARFRVTAAAIVLVVLFFVAARFVAGSDRLTMVVLALVVLLSLSLPSESSCAVVAFFAAGFFVAAAPCRLTARETGRAFGCGTTSLLGFSGEAVLLGSVLELWDRGDSTDLMGEVIATVFLWTGSVTFERFFWGCRSV